jgi:hypothetical protein
LMRPWVPVADLGGRGAFRVDDDSVALRPTLSSAKKRILFLISNF